MSVMASFSPQVQAEILAICVLAGLDLLMTMTRMAKHICASSLDLK